MEQPEVNLYAVIGAKQVQIEVLQEQLQIVSHGFQQLQSQLEAMRQKYEPEEIPPEETQNGHKEDVPDLTLVDQGTQEG